MRALVPLLSLVILAFSGCVDDSGPADGDDAATGEGPSKGPGGSKLSYEIDPESANESELRGAHIHDEWGTTTELTLLDATVETEDCSDPFTTAALAFFGLVTEQEAHMGCAFWRLDENEIVPEGTAWLRVEVDAEDAMQQGGMQLTYGNEETRRQQLDGTSEAIYTWRIPVAPIEWDLPHSNETSWWFLLEPTGQASILDGSVEVFVVAERMPEWEPILGSAHIDHWAPDADHAFIEKGLVYRALDENLTVEMPSFVDRVAAQQRSAMTTVQLTDIVAPASSQVTLAVLWDEVSNCPAGHVCWVVSFMNPGNTGRAHFVEPTEEGDGWALYVFNTPEPLAPDSTYAAESVYHVASFIRACPEADVPDPSSASFWNGCAGEVFASMETQVRIEVEVWKEMADLSAVKARVGL